MGISQFGIPEFKPTKPVQRSVDGRYLKYTVEAAHRPMKCANPACVGMPHVNKHIPKTVRDLHQGGMLVIYELDAKQYQCNVCGKTCVDDFTGVVSGQFTIRLRDKLVERVLRRDTFKKIAADYGVSDQTVGREFDKWADTQAYQFRYETPRILGIDEAHIDKNYRLLVVDIEKKMPIELLENNAYTTVLKYLKELPNKENVRAVTMDFKASYAKAVKKSLNALGYKTLVVIDKFHVVQNLNKKLDKVRKRVQSELGDLTDEELDEELWQDEEDEPDAPAKQLKKEKKLFMMNMEKLKPDDMTRLSAWMRRDKRLEDAYYLKEQFREIYTFTDRPHAEDAFDVWCACVPDTLREFKSVAKYYTGRREHIMNYFDAEFTNAFSESANNILKSIEQGGRGYDFDVLRKIMLLSFRNPRPPKVDPRDLEYETDYRY